MKICFCRTAQIFIKIRQKKMAICDFCKSPQYRTLINFPMITKKHFKDLDYIKEHIDLVTRKEIEIYEYIDSQNKFLETELPSINEFTTHLHRKIT